MKNIIAAILIAIYLTSAAYAVRFKAEFNPVTKQTVRVPMTPAEDADAEALFQQFLIDNITSREAAEEKAKKDAALESLIQEKLSKDAEALPVKEDTVVK
jgi:hypothetical protein